MCKVCDEHFNKIWEQDMSKMTLVTSKNKGSKKVEKIPGPESSNPPPVNQGGGYSKTHKKVKPVKGSFPRNFPQFKVVNRIDIPTMV